jgi:hypothetical protein
LLLFESRQHISGGCPLLGYLQQQATHQGRINLGRSTINEIILELPNQGLVLIPFPHRFGIHWDIHA